MEKNDVLLKILLENKMFTWEKIKQKTILGEF